MISYMKKKGLIILGIIPLLLTSCMKNKNAIRIVNNGNLLTEDKAYFIDIDEERIIGLMNNKMSFILYEYSTGCSYCNDSTSNFEKYLNKYPYAIYRYNAYMGKNYQLLNDYDSSAFPLEYSVPSVMIISKGRFVDKVASSKLVNSRLFNSGINAFTKESKYLYTATTVNGYNKIIEKYDDYDVVIYDSLHDENIEQYNLAYDNNNLDKCTILIDEAFASSQLMEMINE